jgi:hypothetical protein
VSGRSSGQSAVSQRSISGRVVRCSAVVGSGAVFGDVRLSKSAGHPFNESGDPSNPAVHPVQRPAMSMMLRRPSIQLNQSSIHQSRDQCQINDPSLVHQSIQSMMSCQSANPSSPSIRFVAQSRQSRPVPAIHPIHSVHVNPISPVGPSRSIGRSAQSAKETRGRCARPERPLGAVRQKIM